MFDVAADEPKRIWVAMVGGPDVADADYNGVVQLHRRMAIVSPISGDPSIYILQIRPDSRRPEPVWRQRFADAEKLSHGRRVGFCVVTDSSVMRGIRVAVTWLAPPPSGYAATSASNMDEAVAWAEKLRPGSQGVIRSLERELAARLRAPKAGAAR